MHLPTTRWILFAAIVVAVLVTTVSSAGAESAMFSTLTPTVDPLAVNETESFSLNKQDRNAMRSHHKAIALRDNAQAIRDRTAIYDRRIDYIQGLIDEAEGDEERLQAAIAARLVAAYERGENADLGFLLSSASVNDLVDRIDMVTTSKAEEANLIERHEVTLARLTELELALQEMRDARNDKAVALEDTASALEVELVAARDVHEEAAKLAPTKAGTGGAWLPVEGDIPASFLAAISNPITQPYTGGSSTVARQATQLQIMKILSDTRVDIYAGGRGDIQAGRIDGRVIDAVEGLADRFGSVNITSLMSGHGVYTASGNISEHSMGCATDIGSVAGIRIEPATQGPGSITESAVKYLASLTGDLAPHQVISLNSYGGPTMALSDHDDHIHLGYSC